jgi:DNA polymerase III sliding clamp (beta) subunit (PCNA family)
MKKTKPQDDATTVTVPRQEMLDTLKRVEPALSGKDLIQVFACLCFTGDSVHAFDDVVALHLPTKGFGFRGAIRGRVLIDTLASSKAKEATLSQDGHEGCVVVKAGRSKLMIPLLPESEFIFKKLPKMKDGVVVKVGREFVDAFARAMVSMGRDASHPTRLGVTMATTSDPKPGFLFYSSDNKAATRVYLPEKGADDAGELAAILPPRFCELLVEIGKEDEPTQITLTSEWVEAVFTSGLRLFARAILGDGVEMFEGVFARQWKRKPKMVDVPKGLDKALERAMVVAKYAKEPFTAVAVKESVLRLTTLSDSAGRVDDRLSDVELPDVSTRVTPDLLYRALPMAEQFGFGEGCVLLKGDDFDHLITTIEAGE